MLYTFNMEEKDIFEFAKVDKPAENQVEDKEKKAEVKPYKVLFNFW